MTGEITCTRCDSDYDGITLPLPKGKIVILRFGNRIRVYEIDCFSAKVIK